ncbi:hypothetical protein V1519DRAFT_443898, partial [Lipomyces tetrasporus]
MEFTSTAGFQWWYEGVKSLKALGIDSIWKGNNEYRYQTTIGCDLDNEHVSTPEDLQFFSPETILVCGAVLNIL